VILDKADWDQWWKQTMATIRDDPVAQWFYELRNPIVKEGQRVQLETVVNLDGLSFQMPENWPDGSTGVGLHLDGTVRWQMEDGSTLPGPKLQGPFQRWNELVGTPDELAMRPLSDLMEHYISVLEAILDAAGQRFGTE